MRGKKFTKQIRITSVVMIAALVVSLLCPAFENRTYAGTDTSMSMKDFEDIVSTYNIDKSIPAYKDYIQMYDMSKKPSKSFTADGSNVVRYLEGENEYDPIWYFDYEGLKGSSVYSSEESVVEFEIDVPETGSYNVSFLYYPLAGKNSDIERSIFIDGKLPFKELSLVKLSRVWKSVPLEEEYDAETGVTTKIWEYDNQGNAVKPECVEIPEWSTRYVYDSEGYIAEPLCLYLTKGKHILSIVSVKEPLLIGKIIFDNTEEIKSYSEVKAQWDAQGAKDTSGQRIIIEGEYASKTSSQMLYPQQDQASPEVYPSSVKELLNNTIGGNSWRLVGQWIEWEFNAPESGYYEIALHNKQNFSRGVAVSRRIMIDGAVPFEELSAYAFTYAQNWRSDVISDENGDPYKFYLEKGKHTIRMEVVLGDFAEIVSLVDDAVQRLNEVYRSLIKITGAHPDTYRDYQIESSLPGLTDQLIEIRDIIDTAITMIDEIAGKNSEKKTVLLTMRDQLDDLIEDNDYFVKVITSYKINVRACGNWITQVISQPMAIDSISVYSSDMGHGIKKSGFFKKLGHEIARLFYSFIIDYNQIGSVAENTKDSKTITLWIGSGRDQANVIKQLIDETFTNETGINVNVQLVDMSTLLKASLVGEGPDVAIQVANTNGIAGAVLATGNDTPVNYGIRGAVLDLSTFPDCEEVLKRYNKAAYEQFLFDGALYALPDTITFPVMFYRKDILSDIGLELPETWDDVAVAMTVLAKNRMEFGMLPTEQLFASLLYQNGGTYYNEKGDASALDNDTAVNVFKLFCNYYTDYKLDRATSAEERFRTGECPIMISDYTTYNNFAVSAPDIAGLWSFTMIPGTRKEDGTVDHSVASTGLASMIMDDTEYPQESWEFLKWWTSAETQTMYGREMESLMGAAARVPTANYEAFTNMAWPVSDFRALKSAMNWVAGIPQVPGGYYSWRNVNNAFYKVVTEPDVSSPREELMDKVIYINAEIRYKREELNIQ